jgi:hypothetical protein
MPSEPNPRNSNLQKSASLLIMITTGAIAAPADGNTFTVHGVFGGNNYGR